MQPADLSYSMSPSHPTKYMKTETVTYQLVRNRLQLQSARIHHLKQRPSLCSQSMTLLKYGKTSPESRNDRRMCRISITNV